jgi:hypothetical protein
VIVGKYAIDFLDFFDNLELNSDMAGIDALADNNKVGVKRYFIGHLPRFAAGIEVVNCIEDRSIHTIHELGSPYPFFGYYFYNEENCKVVVSDLYDRKWKLNDLLYFSQLNLCVNNIPKSDLIICSEVFEHLPCNLVRVKDEILNNCKYALLSFPLGNKGKDIPLTHDFTSKVLGDVYYKTFDHLREFNGRVDEFLGKDKTLFKTTVTAWESSTPIEIRLVEGKL